MIRGIHPITIAADGVGKPIKESDCLVSTLNRAKRSAENATITNEV